MLSFIRVALVMVSVHSNGRVTETSAKMSIHRNTGLLSCASLVACISDLILETQNGEIKFKNLNMPNVMSSLSLGYVGS